MSPDQRLKKLADLFAVRNADYKDNYKRFGAIVFAITGPVKLETADDFNRFALFVQVIAKVTRYGHNFAGGGHADSLDDTSVYSQMLREVDDLVKAKSAGRNVTNVERYPG